MLTLSLFRHAKSSWEDPALEDFDRPLAPRGLQAAPRMGAFMQKHALRPDLVLCSPARRTRDTLALVADALGRPRTLHPQELYLATAETMLDCIRGTERRMHHLMLVGHNPGLQSFAVNLIGAADKSDFRALAAKFPTAALAVIKFEAEAWRAVKPAAGRLELFMTPKRLV